MKITCMPSGPLGVNTYLVVDEETKEGFIVDPGGYNPKLTKKVSDEGIEIKYIVLTHGHADHISGVNEHLDDFPDAKVVVHTNEKPMLEDPRANQSLMFGSAQTVNGDIFVNDGDELEVGNLEAQVHIHAGTYAWRNVHLRRVGRCAVQRRHAVQTVDRQDRLPGRVVPGSGGCSPHEAVHTSGRDSRAAGTHGADQHRIRER